LSGPPGIFFPLRLSRVAPIACNRRAEGASGRSPEITGPGASLRACRSPALATRTTSCPGHPGFFSLCASRGWPRLLVIGAPKAQAGGRRVTGRRVAPITCNRGAEGASGKATSGNAAGDNRPRGFPSRLSLADARDPDNELSGPPRIFFPLRLSRVAPIIRNRRAEGASGKAAG